MKLTLTLSVFLLVALLTVCIAEPCYDMAIIKAHIEKVQVECKSEIDAVADTNEKMKAASICGLRKHGAIDGNNVVYDKLREAFTAAVLPGKTAIVTAACDACKDKFTTLDNIKEGKMCVFGQLKDQCSDVKALGEQLGMTKK